MGVAMLNRIIPMNVTDPTTKTALKQKPIRHRQKIHSTVHVMTVIHWAIDIAC